MTSISTEYGKKREAFWDSGKRTAEFLLEALPDGFTAYGTALDFGVGIGRVAFSLAERFERVIGVDVSKVMIDKFLHEASVRGVGNVDGSHINETWDKQPVNFVYSVLTFQHMPDDEVRQALSRLRRVLEQGVGNFQFDTRRGRGFDIARFIPNSLLPWTQRPGMRRIIRSSDVIRSWLTEAGFVVMEESHPDSPLHGFLVRPETPPLTS